MLGSVLGCPSMTDAQQPASDKPAPRAYFIKPRQGRVKGRDPLRLVVEGDLEEAVRKGLKKPAPPKKRA